MHRLGPHSAISVGRRSQGLTRPSTVISERLTSFQYVATLSALVNIVVERDSVLGAASKSLVNTGTTSTHTIPLRGNGMTAFESGGRAAFSSLEVMFGDGGRRTRRRRRGKRITTLSRISTRLQPAVPCISIVHPRCGWTLGSRAALPR